ncbi:acyl dehydratase [Trinickia terrae]|uniref:Acyl dehydratase n=1 Tax=Trinickia terrae TaxID=2571161 RepID=A0A4U1HKI5_9BURK|nr:acyl dehydratase [Trinickia terrae]
MNEPTRPAESGEPPDDAPRRLTIEVVDKAPAPHVLYARVLAGLVKRRRAAQLPASRFVLPAATLEPAAVERYARVCGFAPGHGVPLTYPHLLAFPLHLMLLTEPGFPWPALGIVHLANRVRLWRPLAPGDTLRIEAECGPLLAHERGQAFTISVRIYRRGETVWEGDSRYLKRNAAAHGLPLAPLPLSIDRDALARQARWPLPSRLGRDYAQVSGDFNPIHLTMLTAKVFGFSRAIAHGMWTLAHAAAALQPRAPLAAAELDGEFKLPLFLPGEASLWSASRAACEREFEVRDAAGDKPHLRGRFNWDV